MTRKEEAVFWDRREANRKNATPAIANVEPSPSFAPSFLTPTATMRAALGADASVNGRLSFTRPTRLDGTLRGEVHSSDVLVIGETGLVNGTVRADTLVILGRVHGEVVATQRIEVGRGGILQADIEARSLVVQEGGYFEGRCRISPPTRATVHVLHPKAASQGSTSSHS